MAETPFERIARIAEYPPEIIAVGRQVRKYFETDGEAYEGSMRYLGKGLAPIVDMVIGHEMDIRDAEDQLGWPKGAAAVVLRIALSRAPSDYVIPESDSSGVG